MNNSSSEYKEEEVIRVLEEYIKSCVSTEENNDSIKAGKKTHGSNILRFPNLAGFCRYFGISMQDFERISKDCPQMASKILTVLEDEALNSGLSATIVSAYMKKRLNYDSSLSPSYPTQLQIKFEHDIFEDGE